MPFPGDLKSPDGLCDAEVEHARDPVCPHDRVVRTHVAVNDTEKPPVLVGRLVRCVKTREQIGDDRADYLRRDALLARSREAQKLAQRLAVDVLHDDEKLIGNRQDIQGSDDVRVPDARRQPGLVDEHRGKLLVLRQVRVQPLHGDRSREPARAGELAEVDPRHATRGDCVVDGVAPDARGRRHLLNIARSRRCAPSTRA